MRRRLVWIQKAPPQGGAIFLLYYRPNVGYYVVAGESAPVLVTYDQDFSGNIFIQNAGFTAISETDWRFSAIGLNSSIQYRNLLFYGPLGLTASYTTAAIGISAEGTFGSGLLLGALDQRDGILQRYWYTESASGNGPNTFPNSPPSFALPGQTFSDNTGPIFQNADLTYAVRPGQLLAADGTLTTITSGEPSPWPSHGSFVGLTLFVFDWPPTGGSSITFTPYTYNPATGTATAGTPFTKTYTPPPEEDGYSLRYVSYWSANP